MEAVDVEQLWKKKEKEEISAFRRNVLNYTYLTFLVPFQLKFVIFYEWDVYFGTLIDVESFKAICENSRVISLTKKDCFMYIFDGHHFQG